MIFFERPEDFHAEISVVACYVLFNGRFILLQRQPNKTHGGKWGLPAGKVQEGESELSAIVREVAEETGITLTANNLTKLQPLWVRNGEYDFEYHTFLIEIDAEPSITLNEYEHQNFTWVFPQESLKTDLIHDLGECNKFFFSF